MFLADLHIHSRYSRATSPAAEPVQLDLFARRKGLELIASGDFTHAAYRQELAEKLEPAEDGLYMLKPQLRAEDELQIKANTPRFIISGEISSIYKDNGKTRKIHNVILLPSLEHAQQLSGKLEALGCNLRADGRPIIGLSAHDLLEMTLDVCEDAIFIPAHIWTPHFSLFGAYSGYDAIEECFRELTGYIHALETGLSSDPQMNRRISALDKYALISNSDAHSPNNLAREANIFNCQLSYPALAAAIGDRQGQGLAGTIEFFPEEGKYHWDGHRSCKYSCRPGEAIGNHGICPVCGGRLTYGVDHRIMELADRPEDFVLEGDKPWQKLAPLAETVAACLGMTTASKKVAQITNKLMQELGPELTVLRETPLSDIAAASSPLIAEGISRMRRGKVTMEPGYDGVYGKVRIFTEEELAEFQGQGSLFAGFGYAAKSRSAAKTQSKAADKTADNAEKPEQAYPYGLNQQQWQAASAQEKQVVVLAGPGTGKTHTLICRILHLLAQGVPPERIMAVTFTNKAARELNERLQSHLHKKKLPRGMQIGTFHGLALRQLESSGKELRLIDDFSAQALAEAYLQQYGSKLTAKSFLSKLSAAKNGSPSQLPAQLAEGWQDRLTELNAVDFDDLLLQGLALAENTSDSYGRHLLVDEFQDINPLQFRLVQAWSKDAASLFIIGDPAQAIYGFRGADAACFDRFCRLYPSARVIGLTQNYRSTANILSASLPLLDKEAPLLQSARGEGSPVRLAESESPLSEGIFIASEIDRIVGGIDMLTAHKNRRQSDANRSLADIAILYRTNKQAEQLAYCLEKAGIPYRVSGREDYLADEQVRLCLTFFRWLLDDKNKLAELTCRNYYNEEQLAKLKAQFLPWDKKASSELLISRWIAANYLDGNEALEKLRSAALLNPDIRDFILGELLGKEADITRSSSKEYQQEAVSLMTLHAAKGLEFPVVFLAGVKEGLIPFAAQGLSGDIQEEKRLFYVGMTRARDELILSGWPKLSDFLKLIPADRLLHEKAVIKHKIKADQLSLF